VLIARRALTRLLRGVEVVKVVVKGRQNYWRFTVYSWLLEVKDLLKAELGENVEVYVEDGASEDPELYINGVLIGSGVPGEEGYLIEIIKKAVKSMREAPTSSD
jgi:hypothetical protein